MMAMAAALTLTVAAMAQKGTISGKVVDKSSQKGVEYASVVLLNEKDSSMVKGVGAMTSANGSFSITAPYGNYLVRVTFMGYKPFVSDNIVRLGAQHQSVALGKIAIEPSVATLNTAVVKAERSMMEYQLDKRVVNVDKNIVASGGTATDVLQNVPSVAIDNDGNVSLRGSSNVKVLINGRPYELMGNDLETILEQTPAASVESVEVITNPSAKYDPEGMSGIINIKLKDKSSAALGLNGVASLNVGTPLAFIGSNYPDELPALLPTAMATLNLNYSTEKYNLFFSADGGMRSRGSRGHSNIERMRDSVPWSHDTLDQYNVNRNYMGTIKVGGEYYFNSKNSLLASYQLRGGDRQRTSTIHSTDLFSNGLLNYDQEGSNNSRNANHQFNLHYTKKFDRKDEELTVDATYSRRSVHSDGMQEQTYYGSALYDNYYLRETEGNNKHRSLNLQLNYARPFDNQWKLETGYEGRMDWPDQDAVYYRTEYDTVHNLVRRYDALSSTHFIYTQQVHAIYATFGGKVSDQFSLQAGLRGEYAITTGNDANHPATQPVDKRYFKLYPTLHLSYAFSEKQSMQLSYSRRVRRPHMWDLNPFMDIREGQELGFGNPNLDPEFTNAVELSYNLGFEKTNFYASAYFRQTNNMMTRYGYVWDSASAAHYSWWEPYNSEYDGYWASTWQNLDKGVNYGLELIVDCQLAKWWKMNVSVNLYRSIIKGTELLNNDDKSAFQASGKVSSYMTLPHDWTIQLSGQYWAPWLDLQTEMFASYWVDLAVKKDVLSKRATVNLRVGDLLCTGGWGHETHTAQLNRVVHSKRISPTVTIGFTYKINNGLRQQQQNVNDVIDDGSNGGYGD